MDTETSLPSPNVLTCWKDIACYMGKGVRTVQRWEQKHGLPVRRPLGANHKSAILANAQDLDHWLTTAWTVRIEENGTPSAPPDTHPAFRSELSRGIETSRQLRGANRLLLSEIGSALQETRSALQTLVQSCDQLAHQESGSVNRILL